MLAGEGGKVVVWSDDITRFHGSISARGGAQGGNGGMVEVSGKQHLLFAGAADTSAPFGTLGTLLLDPTVLHIRDTGGAGQEDGFLEQRGHDRIIHPHPATCRAWICDTCSSIVRMRRGIRLSSQHCRPC